MVMVSCAPAHVPADTSAKAFTSKAATVPSTNATQQIGRSSDLQWPDGWSPGMIYPVANGRFRVLGESDMTRGWLGHDAILVGCPVRAADDPSTVDDAHFDAAAGCFDGQVVGRTRSFIALSIPAPVRRPLCARARYQCGAKVSEGSC